MTEIAEGCPKYGDPSVTCYCDACLDRACDENGVPRVTGKRWDEGRILGELMRSRLASPEPAAR